MHSDSVLAKPFRACRPGWRVEIVARLAALEHQVQAGERSRVAPAEGVR